MRKIQRHTKEQMYALILKWDNSGLTQEKFFEQHGIPKSTFGYWRKKYLRETVLRKEKDNFIPVTLGHATEKSPELLEVIYPNGVRLVCSSAMDLSRLKPLIVL
jgi:hypothetical protein